MYKKLIILPLIFVMIFTVVMPAYASSKSMIGDEDARTYNIIGDIEAEILQEELLFKPMVFSTDAMLTENNFDTLAVQQVSDISGQQKAIWDNWPMARWSFSHTKADGIFALSGLGTNITAWAGDFIANKIFDWTKILTILAINLCVIAFNTNIVAGMAGWIAEGVQTIFDRESDLTWLMISWGLIFLLIYTCSLFLKRQFSSAISALLVACLAVGGVFFFAANSQKIITDVANATDGITGVFLKAVGSYTSVNHDINLSDPLNRGLLACGQSAWNAIVAAPWSVAMFGTNNIEDLKLTESEAKLIQNSVGGMIDPSKKHLIREGARIDTLYLSTTGKVRQEVVDILGTPTQYRYNLPHPVLNIRYGEIEVDHGRHPGTVVGLSPYNTHRHIMIAAVTLLPAIAFFILSISLAAPILFAQIMLAGLLLMLPAGLFALMVPNIGYSLAGKYFSLVGKFFMVKMVYGLYLSLVLSIATVFVMAVI